eukprot:2372904-Amphidinium_carterae.1
MPREWLLPGAQRDSQVLPQLPHALAVHSSLLPAPLLTISLSERNREDQRQFCSLPQTPKYN